MRLIDADDLLEGREDHEMISTHLIWNAPTIDAVPVVRCKDCAHYNAGFECLIEGYGIERNPNWFCADGERRTDERSD